MYAYVNNNPVGRTDPKGEFLFALVLVVLAVGLVYEAHEYFKATGERIDNTIQANKNRADAILSIPNGNPAADQQKAANAAESQEVDNLQETGKEGAELNKKAWTDKANECFAEGAHGVAHALGH